MALLGPDSQSGTRAGIPLNVTTARKAAPSAHPSPYRSRSRRQRAARRARATSALAASRAARERLRPGSEAVMPRSFGRVLASIWDDGDFRADLSPVGRFVYIFLFSQPDIDHAGVIPL